MTKHTQHHEVKRDKGPRTTNHAPNKMSACRAQVAEPLPSPPLLHIRAGRGLITGYQLREASVDAGAMTDRPKAPHPPSATTRASKRLHAVASVGVARYSEAACAFFFTTLLGRLPEATFHLRVVAVSVRAGRDTGRRSRVIVAAYGASASIFTAYMDGFGVGGARVSFEKCCRKHTTTANAT